MTFNNMSELDPGLVEILLEAKFEPETFDNPERVPTGSLALDYATSGGWPRGRWSEIWGDESSGKTTTTLLSIAGVTQNQGFAAFIDVEGTFDESWAKKLGIDLSRLYVSRPTSTEDTWNITRKLINTNAFDLIVVDSIAALVASAELAGDIGDQTVAINARLNQDFLKRTTRELEATKTAVVLINHLRFKIGAPNASMAETTPGGQAIRQYCSIRVRMEHRFMNKHNLYSKGEIVGSTFHGIVNKSKVGPPFREFEFVLRQDDFFGVDQIAEAGPLAVKLGIFQTKNGGVFTGKGNAYFNGQLLGNGTTQVCKKLYDDTDDHALFREVDARIREALHKFSKPVEVVEDEPEADALETTTWKGSLQDHERRFNDGEQDPEFDDDLLEVE